MRLVPFRTVAPPCSGGNYDATNAVSVVRAMLAPDSPDPELTIAKLDPNDTLNAHLYGN